ncbi:MAG: alpha/beta hydrolase [Micrococcales bacterium]
MRAEVKIFGGGSVRASRAELDRVRHQVDIAKQVLFTESVTPGLNLLTQLQLMLELPALLPRFEAIESACIHAAEQYFGNESAIAQKLHGLGRLDVPELATGAGIAGGAVGIFKEAPIEISRTGFAGGITAPRSVAAMAERLQRTSTEGDLGNQAEFRIERFGNHVIVYIPGTKKWSPVAGSNPLDLTSNVHAMASQSKSASASVSDADRATAASERAVLAALRSAKAGAGDEVMLVGHSQGGIIAANIASGRYEFKVAGIVTFGSPIALAEVNSDTKVLALEHTNDPVPMLDTGPNPQRENWVTVKEAYPLARGESPVAVHDLKGYLKLASEVDANRTVRLKSLLTFVRDFAGPEPGKVEWYSVRRT